MISVHVLPHQLYPMKLKKISSQLLGTEWSLAQIILLLSLNAAGDLTQWDSSLLTMDKILKPMKTIENINHSVNGDKYVTLYKEAFRLKCGDKNLNLGFSKY